MTCSPGSEWSLASINLVIMNTVNSNIFHSQQCHVGQLSYQFCSVGVLTSGVENATQHGFLSCRDCNQREYHEQFHRFRGLCHSSVCQVLLRWAEENGPAHKWIGHSPGFRRSRDDGKSNGNWCFLFEKSGTLVIVYLVFLRFPLQENVIIQYNT